MISDRIARSAARFALLAAVMTGVPAAAHHGWSWTEDGMFELRGIITDIYFGNPHPTLDVDVEGELEGRSWHAFGHHAHGVHRGHREGRRRVTALGNRSREETERRMKAVRITVNGKSYDVYPSRVPPA